MERILLVDGSNLLFQMYFGMPARLVSRDGRAIHGTLGFLGALLKMIRLVQPDGVAVLFDGEHENARTMLDAGYKADRAENAQLREGDPFSQLADIYRALDHMGLCHAETDDCETDDWMAAYAKRMGGAYEIVIASMDSDFFQLIAPNVRVLRYRGKGSILCDEAYVRDKFGVPPVQYAQLKALTGDKADNIPGVAGIGVKTAARLLREFGSIDRILERCGEIERAAVRRAIEESSERIRRNLALILLDGVCELPFTAQQMRWRDSGATTVQILHEIGLWW